MPGWAVRTLLSSAVCIAAAAPSLAADPAPPGAALLSRYCVGCHSAKSHQGGLDLESTLGQPVSRHAQTWEKVVVKLRTRYMPPVGLPRPNESEYRALTASLEKSLDAAAAAKPDPGRTETFRRLNRTEYQNSVRDLLHLETDVASLLPADEASHGFDNVAIGELSPTLLERYLTAVRKISRLAVGTPPRSPGGDTMVLKPDLTQEGHFDALPFGTRGGQSVRYTFPADAEYEIQIRLARDRNEHIEGLSDRHEIDLMLDGERLKTFAVAPPAVGVDHSLVDKHMALRVQVKAGPHQVSAAFLKSPTPILETERQPYQAQFNMDRHPRQQPAVYSLTINGPYELKGAGDTPSRRRIFICTPSGPADEPACAAKILSGLMRRAYRRPVTAADRTAAMKFYEEGAKTGGFEQGIEMALRSVLISPEFLFRVEQDPPAVAANTAYPISDLELASRLSFFLWGSIPDDELLQTAIARKLRSPGMLEKQTRRMLADARSQTLVTSFAGQWLYLTNLASVSPDMRLFPDFDDNLRQSMRQETELFFESVMREDRNVLDLITANYTFLNERLAKHYGIPNVYGGRFRRITFSGAGQRGGLIGQGSVLTVTSYATRTSPVIRGKWVLDNILGAPPPPPPAAVPSLKENTGVGKALPMRQRLAEHRANPACSGCHNLMDPIGFSLENYDALGRWRTQDAGEPIDSAGGLPDGSKFDGVAGLQKNLAARPELFASTFTTKLLTYALGRGVDHYDAPAIRAVVREAGAKDYRFSSIVIGIVNSTPFQMRRSQ